MKSILDRSFHYTPARLTDIRRTFRRVRTEQKAQAEAERKAKEEADRKVVGKIKGAAK